MAALAVKALQRHGCMASEMLAAIVVQRAARVASAYVRTPRRALEIGLYVASVEAGLGVKRVARGAGVTRQRLKRLLPRLEDQRDGAGVDRLIRASAEEALA